MSGDRRTALMADLLEQTALGDYWDGWGMIMSKRVLVAGMAVVVALGGIGLMAGSVAAQVTEQVYGNQLMTEQERLQYRQQMKDAATDAERDQIRARHHEQMQARAKERGITLPDQPLDRGMHRGAGQGMGPGQGTGPGQGMGPGKGMGPGGGRGK